MSTEGPDPIQDPKEYLLLQYQNAVDYYWRESSQNKALYKRSRFYIIALGALLTLIASLASASFVSDEAWLDRSFAIATPVLAALLAILTGVSQNFQWGAAWREMVLTAQTLEKRMDRIRMLSPEQVARVKEQEIEQLHEFVIKETRQFFERVTGSARRPEEPESKGLQERTEPDG